MRGWSVFGSFVPIFKANQNVYFILYRRSNL